MKTDSAIIYYSVKPENSALTAALKTHHEDIETATGTPLKVGVVPEGDTITFESSSKIKEAEIQVFFY